MFSKLKKQVEKIVKNSKGMSLAEIVVSAGLLGGGALVLMKGSSLLQQSEKVEKVSVGVQLFNDDMLAATSQLLLSSRDDSEKRTKGICRMAYTTSKNTGIGQIFLDLSQGGTIFTQDAWANSFGNWTPAADERCRNLNGWSKCFKYNNRGIHTGMSEKMIEDMNIGGSIQVIPVRMNPRGGDSLFSTLETDLTRTANLDAKDVSFRIISIIYSNDNGKEKTKIGQDFIWAPNVGVCDSTLADGTTPVVLSLSGAGASDPSGQTVYNRAGFAGNAELPIQVEYLKRIAQQGLITDSGDYISTDTTKNIVGSCNEVVYRCPKSGSNTRHYGSMSMTLDVDYNDRSTLGDHPSVRAKTELRMVNDAGNILDEEDYIFSLDGDPIDSRKTIDGEPNKKYQRITLRRKSHMLDIKISDNKEDKNNNGLCRNICKPQTNYNQGTSGETNQYRPEIVFKLIDFANETYSIKSDEPFGCTACYMKNCSQFGLGTFGPMNDQPAQPLDSVVPECHMTEAPILKFSPVITAEHKLDSAPVSNPGTRCVKARYNRSQNKLEYKNETCATTLPVMCYNFGKFLFARNVHSEDGGVARIPFWEGPRRCFDMGREVADSQNLLALLGASEITGITSNIDGKYDFINLANTGSFIAPQTEQDLYDFYQWATDEGADYSSWFWVAKKVDNAMKTSYLPPMVPALTDTDRTAFFYNATRVLTHRDYNFNLLIERSPAGTKDGVLLAHHIKYRGILPARKNNPMEGREFHFICRKNGSSGEFFLSEGKSENFNNGPGICNSDGGIFIAPNSTSSWVVAMNAVKKFAANFSYPDPWSVTADTVSLAWVALETEGNGMDVAMNASMPEGGSFSYEDIARDDLSSYRPNGIPGETDSFVISKGDGRLRSSRPMIVGNYFDPSDIKLGAGAKLRFKINGVERTASLRSTTDTTPPEKTFTLSEVINKLRSESSDLDFAIEDETGTSRKRIIVYGKDEGAGKEVRLESGVWNKVGLSSGSTDRVPNFKFLCLKDGVELTFGNINGCSGSNQRKVEHREAKGSQDFKIGVNALDGYYTSGYYALDL